MRSRLGPERVSERRGCPVLGQPRNTQRYHSRRVDDENRFGSGRIYRLLTQRGWTVNEKRVHRLWKREPMQVPRKQHRKRRFPGGSKNGCVRHRTRYKDHVWLCDFATDRTEDGRELRLLVVIDEYTRQCLATEVGRLFAAQYVMGVL